MYSRRSFLKTTGAFGLSAGCFLPILSAKEVPSLPAGDDYKALVCVYLHGGNDSLNMLPPADAANYQEYFDIRGGGENPEEGIAVANTVFDLPDLANKKLTSSTNPYAAEDNESAGLKGVYETGLGLNVNGVMPEIAHLIHNQKIKIISNVGNLVEPLTKEDIASVHKEKPSYLFSHSNQRMQVDIGRADLDSGFGWAGRIADLWFGTEKYDAFPFGMNFSLRANGARMLEGAKTRPYVVQPNPVAFNKMKLMPTGSTPWVQWDENLNRRSMYHYLNGASPINPDDYSYAEYNNWKGYVPSPLDLRNRIPEASPNYLKRVYQKMGMNALRTNDAVLAALGEDLNFTSTDSYGQDLFTVPEEEVLGLTYNNFGSLIQNLETITKMMKVGVSKGYRRQIFLVQHGGFDTHGSQLEVHPRILRELSLGMAHFNSALEELGLSEKVVTYSTSDFGRTVSSNGDGTDHGWGGNQMIMGGGIDKSEIIGKLPSLAIGGADDYSEQGRIIPSIANIQIQAELAHWLGVESDYLTELFPHLPNFQNDPSDATSSFVNLGFSS
jgi:uncharacterized protein (DUF1501 family)